MINFLFFNKKAQQLKELEASFVAATKEMQSAQAKMAVETAKEVSPPLNVDLKLLCQKLLYWECWLCQGGSFQ